MVKLLSLFLFLIPTFVMANPMVITEGFLKKLVDENPPKIQQIEASFVKAQAQREEFEENFDLKLEADAFYLKSYEKQLNAFSPVNSPIRNVSLGFVKPLKYGMSASLKGISNNNSNNFVKNATTTALKFQLAMDIYKDFLGRTTRGQEKSFFLTEKKAALEKTINQKTFFQNVRKIYWSLVANEEAIKFSRRLLEASLLQVKESEKRFKSRVADAGEVAKYQSQYSTRKSSLLFLEFNKETLLKQLKELFPSLANEELTLGTYDVEETVNKVLICTQKINLEETPPLNYSLYDEIMDLNNQNYEAQKNVIDAHDRANVKLLAAVSTVGKATSYSDSIDDFKDHSRGVYELGISVSIPLGSSASSTEKYQRKLNDLMNDSSNRELQGKLNSFHNQIVKSVRILQEVVRNQKENVLFIKKSLDETQKKYNQARVNVQQLVQEQDLYFQSNLNEIDTKLTVINTLIDYFTVFTETPCKLNEF